MSLWSRIGNVFRRERLLRELDEELASHIDEGLRAGRDPEELRRALGRPLSLRERSFDLRVLPWLESLRADAVFGWRQVVRRPAISAAVVLSLGLAMGSCLAAFRLADALLWRPLPIAHPERLYLLGELGFGPGGDYRLGESSEYPLFRQLREAAKGDAALIAVSYAERVDLTYRSDEEMERPWLQYVSGGMFSAFGVQPAAGRLLTSADDQTPGLHAYAVLSYDYWRRRFGREAGVIGRRFRMGSESFEIVGVAGPGFTGTEPGIVTDVFMPTMMHPAVNRDDSSWFRCLVMLRPGVDPESLQQKLAVVHRRARELRASQWTGRTKSFIGRFLDQKLVLEPASSGASGMQRTYRLPLIVIGVLVLSVLLVACLNVANLLSVQAASRSREMALRASTGAGRRRLMQMVLVESAWLGVLSAVTGGAFGWWAAPWVAGRINAPDNPARLILAADWRVFAFAAALTVSVTLLFGLLPAFRVSCVRPASALKGGEPLHARHRLMYALIAAQVAFSVVIHFASGLLVGTVERLSNQPVGFSADRLVALTTVARPPQTARAWDQALGQLRGVPGVETVALSGWTLLSGNGWNGFIWVDANPTGVLAYFLGVSPGWRDAMHIPLVAGRDLLPDEMYPAAGGEGAALVNEAFVEQCLHGERALGRWIEKETGNGAKRDRFQIAGVVRNARYRNLREPMTPTVYVPFHAAVAGGGSRPQNSGTFIVRTRESDPMTMAETLRREVHRASPELRVSRVARQSDLNLQQTVRERLLALLAAFFAALALLLIGVGIFGALSHVFLTRRREFGIRIAIGAKGMDIARSVAGGIFVVIGCGVLAGLALSLASVHQIEALLYGLQGTERKSLLVPSLTIFGAAVLAALPPLWRSIRIDPSETLRAE